MATEISSMFAIIHDVAITTGNTLAITNPGRPFQIMDVTVAGTGTTTVSVGHGVLGAASVVCATGAIADSALNGSVQLDMKIGSTSVGATEEVRVTCGGISGSITKVVLYCVGSPALFAPGLVVMPQVLTTTTTA